MLNHFRLVPSSTSWQTLSRLAATAAAAPSFLWLTTTSCAAKQPFGHLPAVPVPVRTQIRALSLSHTVTNLQRNSAGPCIKQRYNRPLLALNTPHPQKPHNPISRRTCVSMSAQYIDRDVLPDIIKPTNYDLSLYDIELGGAFQYSGTVTIKASVIKSTREVVLNANELVISAAEFRIGSKVIDSSSFTYDKPRQRATITFPEDIPVTEDALLAIKFGGTINHSMAGFYRSKYKPPVTPAASVPKDGDSHVMFSTQFESCDARRAFPCFDEPNLKATFDFEIEIPDDQVALSNMPEKSTRSSKPGTKIVSFDTTPIMSTYLLAWAVGDFEYIEDFTKRKYKGKPLPVRVYTTRGLKEQAQYALDHAPQVIDYFSEIFDIDYPLPKSDLLAVHEFTHGAMENWGLVTYRTTAVLFDEKTSDAKYKNRIAYVVAHELAHQWFGNLVTMDWWNELWLNEGFATWVGWHATDKIHPDWNVWPQFIAEGMQTAFTLDSLRSSHPIEVPVKDALDVDQIFDSISYLKGSSVIRMLAAHLGQDVFLKGVSNYLKAHAFSNATTNDLWSALSEASEQDIHALMEPWIRKIGFPVVTVAEEPGQIGVKQNRYLGTGDAKPEDDDTTWWVPLGLQGKAGVKEVASIALTKKADTIRDTNDSFYKLNVDTTGFYRTNYPPSRLATLGKQIDRLSLSDKIGLVGDAGALSVSGDASTTGLLSLTEGFSAETDFLVWSQVLSSLGTIKSCFSENEEISNGLKKFILKLIGPTVDKLGWKASPTDDILTTQLRAQMIMSAGMNGHSDVIAEAQRRFELYFSGKDQSAVDPNLRAAIYGIAIRYGGLSEFNFLKKEWETTSSVDGKEITLRALGRIQTPELFKAYINFAFTNVATQDAHIAAMALSVNSKTRHGLWAYIQENFDPLLKKLSDNMVIWDRFIRLSLNRFSDEKMGNEIAVFFADKDVRGYDRALAIIGDTIRGRAAYKARDEKIILEWLQANSYA
ncbi:aminopeptidase-like protein [Calycina marina]|uniref:Aminopeptidase n=1 Tax=Calycina marina TaxID=1763456 RepID=A0A9P7Z3C4_9HELO|nr:aminopeptidase-like protein [Calycina marina]